MPTPIASYASALAAYGRAATVAGIESATTEPAAATAGAFSEMVKGILDGAIAAGKAGEARGFDAIANRGDLASAVTAVAEADVALQGVIAIRDRALDAYKDIMRMPI